MYIKISKTELLAVFLAVFSILLCTYNLKLSILQKGYFSLQRKFTCGSGTDFVCYNTRLRNKKLKVSFPELNLSAYGDVKLQKSYEFYSAYQEHYIPFADGDCPFGEVKLSDDNECQKWLGCDDLSRLDPKIYPRNTSVPLGQGANKSVYQVRIGDYDRS